jgi:hypothetical protein
MVRREAVHAGVHRRVGVLDRLGTFEHDKFVSVLAQKHDVRPRAEGTTLVAATPCPA